MKILSIVGPTASGKTSLALEVARAFGGEIVGADASQVYRGLDIGTGKVTREELGTVRHHLLDVVAPDAHFDVAEYIRLADEAIEAVRHRGNRVILCGGTGLYLRGLISGLCAAPPTEAGIKAEILERIARGELGAVYEELQAADPIAAERINPNDAQRIERALGVFLTSGKALSTWQEEHRFADERYSVVWIGIRWSMDVLEARIAQRIEEMLDAGWLEEVAHLMECGYRSHLNSMQALGYRFLAQHIEGELSLDEARERTLIATRRYAKRQMKWFRANPDIQWLDGPATLDDLEETLKAVWPGERT